MSSSHLLPSHHFFCAPFIWFLFLGISLPLYPLQQKMPVLLVAGDCFRRRFDLGSLALHIMRGRKFL